MTLASGAGHLPQRSRVECSLERERYLQSAASHPVLRTDSRRGRRMMALHCKTALTSSTVISTPVAGPTRPHHQASKPNPTSRFGILETLCHAPAEFVLQLTNGALLTPQNWRGLLREAPVKPEVRLLYRHMLLLKVPHNSESTTICCNFKINICSLD